MTSVIEHFAADHRACDEVFARAEAAAASGNQAQAMNAFARFAILLEAHFGAEEEIIFPAFEASSGMSNGPTEVMRYEHQNLLDLCRSIQRTLEAGQLAESARQMDTLFTTMQAHNMKEEQVLYPMCDAALSANPAIVAEAVARLASAGVAP